MPSSRQFLTAYVACRCESLDRCAGPGWPQACWMAASWYSTLRSGSRSDETRGGPWHWPSAATGGISTQQRMLADLQSQVSDQQQQLQIWRSCRVKSRWLQRPWSCFMGLLDPLRVCLGAMTTEMCWELKACQAVRSEPCAHHLLVLTAVFVPAGWTWNLHTCS
jgi:hypothetical protein